MTEDQARKMTAELCEGRNLFCARKPRAGRKRDATKRTGKAETKEGENVLPDARKVENGKQACGR